MTSVFSRLSPLFVSFACLILTGPALGQRGSRDVESEVEQLLQEARAAYDNLELEQADAALERASELGTKHGLRGRTLAEVYVQRGILAHVRKDKNRAIDEFKQALQLDRAVRLDPLVSTPTLETLFETARREVGPGDDRGGGRQGGDDRGASSSDDQITHKPVKRAKADQNLAIQAKVASELRDRMYRMYLYFRSKKADGVQRIQMKAQGDDTFIARIPSRFVKGEGLSYYILVEDRAGDMIAQVQTSQNAIMVEVEDFGSGDSLAGDEEEGEEGDEEENEEGDSERKFVSVGIGIGSGGGFVTERARAQNQPSATIQPGFAPAPFHTFAELDFHVTPDFSLGAFARIQIVEFAHLEGGRLKYTFAKSDRHRVAARLGGGVGQVRHLVPLKNLRDTTLEGNAFYTLGVGYALELNRTISFVVSPDFVHLIGPSPSLHFDLNLGIALGF